MAKKSMSLFNSADDQSFGYTPDTAYFTLDGIFRQGFPKIASDLTLNHLENYNFHKEWKIPMAPEAYRRDLACLATNIPILMPEKFFFFSRDWLAYLIQFRTIYYILKIPCQWVGIGWNLIFP